MYIYIYIYKHLSSNAPPFSLGKLKFLKKDQLMMS